MKRGVTNTIKRQYFKSILLCILLGIIVFVSAVSWNDAYQTPKYFNEDEFNLYNFSKNLTETENFSYFSILNIQWEDGSLGPEHSDFYWLNWNDTYSINSTSGLLNINSINDNETGNFTLNALVQGTEGGESRYFNFIINATNDAPEVGFNETYSFEVNSQENTSGNIILSGTDEEEHYPLIFQNITFFDDCEPAEWSPRKNASNCSFTYDTTNEYGGSDQSVLINLTNIGYYDVGVYPVQICINDTLPESGLPTYKDSNYEYNKTTCENASLIIQSTLSVDTSDCDEKIISEDDDYLTCNIIIKTQGKNDSLSIESTATLKNYPSAPSGSFNSGWFYASNETNAADFYLFIPINISLEKVHVGNWTINFSVEDTKYSQESSSQIDIFINRSSVNSPLSLTSIENRNISINQLVTIYFNISDNDLLIPDKNLFNEEFTLNYTASIESENYTFDNLVIEDLGQITGTNISRAKITLNSTEAGDYEINVSATDKEDSSSYTLFNITISNNTSPYWKGGEYAFDLNTSRTSDEEGFNFYRNLTDTTITEENFYVKDDDNDTLTFSNSSGVPPRFNLTSDGIINFTPWKQDVGIWNFNITASDGYLEDTTHIILNISNNNTAPQIGALYNNTDFSEPPTNAIPENNTQIVPHGESIFWRLYTYDDDFLISETKVNEGAYNETLNISTNIINLTPAQTPLTSEDISFLIEQSPRELEGFYNRTIYNTTFTPQYENVGNYSVNITITDFSGEKTNRLFYLNITEFDYPPSIVNESLNNATLTIYENLYLDINATDEKDGNDTPNGNLTFSISNLTTGGNFINTSNFNETTGIINLTNLSDYEGEWLFNISVNDTSENTDWKIFKLSIYGIANLTSPSQNSVFNFTEVVEKKLTLSFNNSLGGNLTYELWIDNITCSYLDNSNCNYTDFYMIDSFENIGNSTEFNYSWTQTYFDETYGNLKNLTIKAYPSTEQLNESQKEAIAINFSFKLNISHTNAPLLFISNIGPYYQKNYNQNLEIDLNGHFLDYDKEDPYYEQEINFTIHSNSTPSTLASPFSTVSEGWILTIPAPNTIKSEWLYINATDLNSEGEPLTNNISNQFKVEFTTPSVQEVERPATGGTSTLLKLFSIRIIVPQDIIIYEKDSIEIPFTLENTGEIDLKGLDVTNIVLFNNVYSEDVKVFIEPIYLPELKIGESQNMTMRILADTQKTGRYKATVYVDVTSPKFSDWGDFFIDLRRINDTEAEQTIIFTEKLISENPECLELSELIKEARKKFEEGDSESALTMATEIATACEDAIKANEQVKFKLKDYISNIFYYVLFATASVLLLGFIIYIYKRTRFNK
ncbi:MAG: hypothetical protein WC494_03015 [Candidatus Pacearchaeota archaeon]